MLLRPHLLVVSVVVLVACGSDDSNPAGSTTGSGGGSGTTSTASGVSSASASTGASTGSSSGTGGGATSSGSGGGGSGTGISSMYPGDVGIETDPDVVWVENFEEGSAGAFFARYDDAKQTGFALDGDVPAMSSGSASGKLTASGAGPNAVDFFKNLAPGYDELFVRYYAKYQANIEWHHTGVWVGGYNPPLSYPSPQAGLKPNGDDRFSVSLEPMEQGATPRIDFYNYWMQMHSWMDMPMCSTAYYGNSIIHDPSLTAEAQWQ